MAETKSDIKALVEQMPEVDKPGSASKFTGPPPKEAAKVYEEILAGGRASIQELINLVRDPADPEFGNYKAEYVLHGLAIFTGNPGREKDRRLLAETLAAQLANEKFTKATRGLFIRELQVAGGSEVVAALAKQVKDEELGLYAIAALQAIGPAGAAALRKELAAVKDRNRIAVIQALGKLSDFASVAELRKILAGNDRDARIAAAWALGNMGDPGALNAVLKAADAGDDWEKVQHTKACLLLAEKLAAAGKRADAKKIYQHLLNTRNGEKEKYVREAAEKAIAGLNMLL
jgi:HEAT repeat protein